MNNPAPQLKRSEYLLISSPELAEVKSRPILTAHVDRCILPTRRTLRTALKKVEAVKDVDALLRLVKESSRALVTLQIKLGSEEWRQQVPIVRSLMRREDSSILYTAGDCHDEVAQYEDYLQLIRSVLVALKEGRNLIKPKLKRHRERLRDVVKAIKVIVPDLRSKQRTLNKSQRLPREEREELISQIGLLEQTLEEQYQLKDRLERRVEKSKRDTKLLQTLLSRLGKAKRERIKRMSQVHADAERQTEPVEYRSDGEIDPVEQVHYRRARRFKMADDRRGHVAKGRKRRLGKKAKVKNRERGKRKGGQK